MVAMILNEEQIDAGEELLKRLDSANVQVAAALWFYFPEFDDWKLLLSLPRLIKQGPQAAYREVQKCLSKPGQQFALSLDDVSIAKLNAPLIQLLKSAIKTGPGISRIRFSKNAVGRQWIEDSLIYRLT